jgi:hypothetical protein
VERRTRIIWSVHAFLFFLSCSFSSNTDRGGAGAVCGVALCLS